MKPYIKPDLFYENFELNQNIAACGWDLQSNDKNTCTALKDPALNNNHPVPGMKLFTSKNECTLDEKDAPGYCYTTGASEFARLYQS